MDSPLNRKKDPLNSSGGSGADEVAKPSWSRKIKAGLIVIWVTLVVTAYYVIHKPWPSNWGFSPLYAILDGVLAFAVLALCGALGRKVLQSWKFKHNFERLSVSLAMGLGVLGTGWMILGWIGLFHSWVAWSLLGIGLIIFRKEVLAWVSDFSHARTVYGKLSSFGKALAWFCGFVIFLSLWNAFSPPLKWDSLVYHLEIPKQYLQAGKLIFLEDNLFVGFPQIAEMFFTWTMALGSASTAATFGWMVGVVGLLGVGGIAARLINKRATFLAPACLLTGASISAGLSWAYVDLWVMLLGLSMIVALDYYSHTAERKWLVLAGIMAGFGMGVKYSAGILMVMAIAVLVWNAIRKGWVSSKTQEQHDDQSSNAVVRAAESSQTPWLDLLKECLFFIIPAGLIFLPWVVKNWAFTGNPLYPYIFPGRAIDSLRQSFHAGMRPERTILDDLLLPWYATVMGVEGGPGFNTSIGPLLLALIPGLLVKRIPTRHGHRESIYRFVLIGFVVWGFWIIGSHLSGPLSRTRHYYAAMPAFAVLAAAGFEALAGLQFSQVRVSRILKVLVLLAIIFSALGELYAFRSISSLAVVLGVQSEEDYLTERLGWYAAAMESLNALPEDSRVQFLWEARAFYCQVDCRPDVILDRWWYWRRIYEDEAAIAENLRARGITHVLLYDLGQEFERENRQQYELADWVGLEQFKKEELTLLKDLGGVYSLYRLRE